MKRLFFFLFSFILVSSCLDDGSGSSQEYTGIADFEYSSITFRSDSTFFVADTTGGFGYDVLNFYHNLDAGKTKVEGGFTISCLEMPVSGDTERLSRTYRCYLPYIKNSVSNIYTVYHQNPDPALMPAHDIEFALTKYGTCDLLGCYVLNTVEVAEAVKENFKDGDKLTLKATGYLNGVKTGKAEIILAEFTEKKDSIVGVWTPFVLDSLKTVQYVDFEIISTNPDIPLYVCMDDLYYNVKLDY